MKNAADAEPQKVVYVKVDDLLRKMDSIHDVLNIPFKGLFVPYYWKNKYEVDFIYDDSMCVLPVEVKYRHHPSSADTRGLIEFMHAFNLNLGIIVTKDVLKKEIIASGKEIIFIPLWLFLLLL